MTHNLQRQYRMRNRYGTVADNGMTLKDYSDLCEREEEEARKAKRRVYQRQYRMRKKQEQKGKKK